MADNTPKRLSEFELNNVLLRAIQQFETEVKTTGTTDWEAFDTLISNLRTYASSFGSSEYLLTIRNNIIDFLIYCSSNNILPQEQYTNYVNRVEKQFNTIMSEQDSISDLVYLIKNLYTKESVFTSGDRFSDFSFKTIAMLLDIPQKIVGFINSEAFRKDLYKATCLAHSYYTDRPTTANSSRFAEFIQILYIIGVLQQNVNDEWIKEVDDSTEFQLRLAELLGLQAEDAHTDVF